MQLPTMVGKCEFLYAAFNSNRRRLIERCLRHYSQYSVDVGDNGCGYHRTLIARSSQMADAGSDVVKKRKLRQAFLRIAEVKQLSSLACTIRDEMGAVDHVQLRCHG